MTPDDPVARARALFDAQVEALDPARAGQLRAARRTALAGRSASAPSRWWPAGGLATAALALALVLPGTRTAPPPATPAAPAAPVDSSASNDEGWAAARVADESTAELDEDAEFYAWLAEAPLDDPAPLMTPTEGTLL